MAKRGLFEGKEGSLLASRRVDVTQQRGVCRTAEGSVSANRGVSVTEHRGEGWREGGANP
jgi:hypothetical protein